MAPEESMEASRLLQGFERRFLAACAVLSLAAMNESSCFSTPSPAFGVISVLEFGHSKRPGAQADSRPGPPRSKAKAGDPAGCLLRRKAFRKPPQRRRLSEGLGHPRTASPLVHQ
ncbi:hypothetical protein QTO34_014666, partial [Cnephaeus nilssonii]